MHNKFAGIARNVVQSGRIDELHIHPPVPVPTGLAGLPADEGLTGRVDELAILAAVLSTDHDPDTPAICMIAGLGGVGKTALAVHAARQAESDGWLSGGVLFIDLYGYDEARRVTAVGALLTLVRLLGVPGEYIPQEQAELETLYRSVLSTLADGGQQVLVLADNAASLDQVLPLRPGRPEHRMVVTTRHTLPIPGARRLELEVLPDADGIAVLDRAVRAANPDDTRVAAEPDAAAALVGLCGGLPLALRIIAQVLADQPDQPVAELVDILAAEQDRLSELAYGDAVGVRVVFDASYRHLPDEQARLFRLLAVNPGPYVDLETAAALIDLPANSTRRLLDELRRAHLVQHLPGFYTMHDLVLLYAGECFDEVETTEDADAAILRLVTHYLHSVQAAVGHLDPQVPVESPRFRDRADALLWLDAQLPNLMAAAELAGDESHLAVMGGILLGLLPYFDLRRDSVNWATASELVVTAARLLGDASLEADGLNSLGMAYRGLRGRLDDAIESFQQALASYQHLGNRDGMAAVLTNLGNAEQTRNRLDEAADNHQQAVALYQEVGNGYGEALALMNLGRTDESRGRHLEALDSYQQAVLGFQTSGDQYRQAAALSFIANISLKLAEPEQAIEYLQRALALHRALGDREGEARSLRAVADGYAELARFDQVIDVHQQALSIWRELGKTHEESELMTYLAGDYWRSGRLAEALEHDIQAITRHQETGNQYGEATIRSYLGLVYRDLGELDKASDCYQRSIAIFEEIEAAEEIEAVKTHVTYLERLRSQE